MAVHEPAGIDTATEADEQRVIDTLVLAFSADPVIRWFYPNSHDYLRHFPEFIEISGGEAFTHGTAYHLQDFSAVALWLPPESKPDEAALVTMFQNSLSDDRLAQAWSVLEALDGYRPSEPYWYLPVIGVEPTQQRKGYGSALMAHALDACDREGTLAYLESSNPENISLYVRHGFEILGTIQEGTMPPLIPMRRTPQE